MTSALGSSWSTNFVSFDRLPFAAASIGQVHNAVLAASVSPTGREEHVAVKIQFPNIANSIESDLGYIKFLLTAGSLLPKGLFLDKTIQVCSCNGHFTSLMQWLAYYLLLFLLCAGDEGRTGGRMRLRP